MQASQSEPETAPVITGREPSPDTNYDDWFDIFTVDYMGDEQVKARYITIWPGMSLTSLWLEVGATDSPLELHKIEVQWAEETRDPNPEIFTEENCAEITRDLKPRCERDVPDQLVVYYWEIGDDQSGENEDAKAAGPEAMCREFQSLGFDQRK